MQSTQKKSYFAIIVIASVALACAVAAPIMLPFVKVSPANPENLYVIYYGHLVDENGAMTDQASRILAAKPELVIVPHSFPDGELNLTPDVRWQFSEADIKVLTYTWTDYGARDLNAVRADIDSQMASGVDGIFVDEVTNIETDAEHSYYAAVYQHIKSHGQDKLAIMNPGHYKVNESIMQISDIVSLEEEWVYHDQISWMDKYLPSRFMGVSSNEYCTACISESNAMSKTAEAWSAGIGYHFSTDKYIDLPAWFDSYALQVEEERKARQQS
ncbi:spherulation-specific family 4 protein [Candidatus Nitrososphaera gargensis]|uniref:spherulation-specific family 4 protein n=1 Tax=Candidatus Nitrososphaera gargensis TaxID=497727 RepID=UPI0011E57270|nr:spherulation-specific family 4 protein [Candidatus Nitrososphaera gargensis]